MPFREYAEEWRAAQVHRPTVRGSAGRDLPSEGRFQRFDNCRLPGLYRSRMKALSLPKGR